MKIWSRYFYREIFKTFFLFVFCFYGLYVLIDYASNANHIRLKGFELLGYYFYEFSMRAEVLIPFALLIATIKTLCKLNLSNELVALLTSGISLRKLITPFLISGLFFTGLMYINNQIILPNSTKALKHLEDLQKSHSKKKNYLGIQHLTLEDGSTFLFQHFDQLEERFYDAYWIKNINEIVRIKYLYPQNQIPFGLEVEHLLRDKEENLVLKASFSQQEFPQMRFNQNVLKENIIQPDEQSLLSLWNALPAKAIESEKEARLVSSFYYKIFLPWLCLFAVIGPLPFCIQFSRTLSVFFIYALSIFGLVAIYLVFDAALILGERHVLPPLIALGTPFLFFSGLFSIKLIKGNS